MPSCRFSSAHRALEHERVQVRPGGVDGGRPTGGPAADNHYVFRHRSTSGSANGRGWCEAPNYRVREPNPGGRMGSLNASKPRYRGRSTKHRIRPSGLRGRRLESLSGDYDVHTAYDCSSLSVRSPFFTVAYHTYGRLAEHGGSSRLDPARASPAQRASSTTDVDYVPTSQIGRLRPPLHQHRRHGADRWAGDRRLLGLAAGAVVGGAGFNLRRRRA